MARMSRAAALTMTTVPPIINGQLRLPPEPKLHATSNLNLASLCIPLHCSGKLKALKHDFMTPTLDT